MEDVIKNIYDEIFKKNNELLESFDNPKKKTVSAKHINLDEFIKSDKISRQINKYQFNALMKLDVKLLEIKRLKKDYINYRIAKIIYNSHTHITLIETKNFISTTYIIL